MNSVTRIFIDQHNQIKVKSEGPAIFSLKENTKERSLFMAGGRWKRGGGVNFQSKQLDGGKISVHSF